MHGHTPQFWIKQNIVDNDKDTVILLIIYEWIDINWIERIPMGQKLLQTHPATTIHMPICAIIYCRRRRRKVPPWLPDRRPRNDIAASRPVRREAQDLSCWQLTDRWRSCQPPCRNSWSRSPVSYRNWMRYVNRDTDSVDFGHEAFMKRDHHLHTHKHARRIRLKLIIKDFDNTDTLLCVPSKLISTYAKHICTCTKQSIF